jgi:hypothetical protein
VKYKANVPVALITESDDQIVFRLHCYFGHMSISKLKQLINQKHLKVSPKVFKCFEKLIIADFMCERCLKSKNFIPSLPKFSSTKSPKPSYLVHFDNLGPKPDQFGGYTHLTSIVNDCTGFLFYVGRNFSFRKKHFTQNQICAATQF